jgi:hypothetical protein
VSHWDVDRQTAIVSLSELEGPLAAAPEILVAAEVVFHGLYLLNPSCRPDDMGHDEARGCLYDVQRTHATVESALDGDGLCSQCLHALAARGLAPDRLLRLHGAVRQLAAGSAVVH